MILVSAALLPTGARAADTSQAKANKPGVMQRQMDKFRQFRLAKAEVQALIQKLPSLKAIYVNAYEGSTNGHVGPAMAGVGLGMTYPAIVQHGLVEGLASANPAGPAFAALGAGAWARDRSVRHARARLAVLGEALKNPELRSDIKFGAIAYYARRATAQQAKDQAALKGAQEAVKKLSAVVDDRAAVLGLNLVQREIRSAKNHE